MGSTELNEIIIRAEKLSPEEQLRLIAHLAERARQAYQVSAHKPAEPAEGPKRSIMELHGLGAEIWKGIDAQEYVNELRKEWDHRP